MNLKAVRLWGVNNIQLRFQIVTTARVMTMLFWVIKRCRLVGVVTMLFWVITRCRLVGMMTMLFWVATRCGLVGVTTMLFWAITRCRLVGVMMFWVITRCRLVGVMMFWVITRCRLVGVMTMLFWAVTRCRLVGVMTMLVWVITRCRLVGMMTMLFWVITLCRLVGVMTTMFWVITRCRLVGVMTMLFWVVTRCRLVGRHQCFGGTYFFIFRAWKNFNIDLKSALLIWTWAPSLFVEWLRNTMNPLSGNRDALRRLVTWLRWASWHLLRRRGAGYTRPAVEQHPATCSEHSTDFVRSLSWFAVYVACAGGLWCSIFIWLSSVTPGGSPTWSSDEPSHILVSCDLPLFCSVLSLKRLLKMSGCCAQTAARAQADMVCSHETASGLQRNRLLLVCLFHSFFTQSFVRSQMRTNLWLESLKGSNHSEDLGVDGRIILKFIFGK
jgi:hypothetical protein